MLRHIPVSIIVIASPFGDQVKPFFPSGETRIYLGFVVGLLLLLAEAATQAFQLVSAVPADVIAPNPRRTFPQVPPPLIRSSSVPSLS